MEVNKIYLGNCLELLKELDDNSIDLTVTSPPYNMRLRVSNNKYVKREKTEHFSKKYTHFDDALPMDEFYSFHKQVIIELLRVSKVTLYNFQIVTGSKEAFFKLIGDFNTCIKDVVVWDKGHGQPAMHLNILNSCYEFLLVLEGNHKKRRLIENAYFDRGTLDNIWRIKRSNSKTRAHTAVFPEQLIETAINNFSKEGDVVLDPFLGTGTTVKVAKRLNRRYIGFELIEEYFNIANEEVNKNN